MLLPGPSSGAGLLAQARPITFDFSAHGAVAYTRVDPVPVDRVLAETKVEQVNLVGMASAAGGHVKLLGTLNLEGLTMPDGVLTLGGWGEGFNERRHPHTYAHELMLSVMGGNPSRLRGSLIVGKGFAPFGTDDPMNRPPLRFPVNHHWSQVLERALVGVGLQSGPVTIEGSLFNGDEPERPAQWPRLARFGDSWSLRGSLAPVNGVELQLSRASVKSPEHRGGAGGTQEKWSVSGRLERSLGGARVYALAEWARTEELQGFFRFESWLVEGAVTAGRHRPYYRLERSDRPEEERTLDLFRSVRPHLENSILGVTRWTIHTVGYGATFRYRPVEVEPLIEIGLAKVGETGGGFFDVEGLFGRRTLWSLTIGLRVRTAGHVHRMGRYGVAEPGAMSPQVHHMPEQE